MLCQYTAAVFLQFFWCFLLTCVTTVSLLLFRSCSESASSMADDLEKIREKNEAGEWSEVNELAEAATHRVPPCQEIHALQEKSRGMIRHLVASTRCFLGFLSLAGSWILIRYLRMQKNWNHQLFLSHTLTWLIQSQFLNSHRNSQLFCWEVLWLLWNHLGGFRRQRLHTFSSSSSHRWPMACVVIGGGSCGESFHVGTWRTAWSRSQHLSRGPSCFFNFWSHARSMWMNAWYFRILNMESSWEGL